MMRGFRLRLVRWLIVLAGLTVVSGCERDSESASRDALPAVRVTRPVARKVTDYAFFTGRTDAVESVDVQSRVTGYLDSVDFKPGAEVKPGERLFRVDPRPYQAALDRATGQVNLAEARLKLAIADYARALEIAKTPGAISKQDVDKYEAARSEGRAAVAAAKANSESARLNLEFTGITSPIEGLVGRNLVTIGNLVKQDETLLTTVVSQDPMYAYFDVDEHTLLRVERLMREGKIGTVRERGSIPVEMGLADEGDRYPHEGKIDFVNNRIDPTTGTLQVRGEFANPPSGSGKSRLLKPGLFVRIRLPIGQPYQAILVPEAAIGTDQGRKYVLAVNAQGVIEYRPLSVGARQPGGLQVVFPVKLVRTKEGLRPADEKSPSTGTAVDSIRAGDRVVVGGLQQVRPGMQVEAREVEPGDGGGKPVSVRVQGAVTQ